MKPTILVIFCVVLTSNAKLLTTTTWDGLETGSTFDTTTGFSEESTIPPENLQDEIVALENVPGTEQNDVESVDGIENMQLHVLNCNRELIYFENKSNEYFFTFVPHDVKPQGQCQITIKTEDAKTLVLIFSDIRLRKSKQDNLKIATRFSNVTLTMKDFNEDEKFGVFLPNVSTVFLIYRFKNLMVSDRQVSFFLSVLSINRK